MTLAAIADVAAPVLFVLLALVWLRASRHFAARLRDPSTPWPDFANASWPVAFVAVVFAAFVAVQTLVAWGAKGLGYSLEGVPALTIQAITNVLTCLFAVAFARRAFGVPMESFGLGRELDRGTATFALSGYATFVPIMFGAALVSHWLYGLRGVESPEQKVLGILGSSHGVATFAWLATLSVVVIPITEEILFRGILYSTLRRRLGRVTAIVATSAAFALLHDTSVMLPVFVVGVCLAILFDRTRSIVASSFAHMLHNGAQVLLLALVRR